MQCKIALGEHYLRTSKLTNKRQAENKGKILRIRNFGLILHP
jgi:hypothetical protein